MNKVLIVSYHFPPSLTIGAQRPYRLAKYFPQYGWSPVVLTVKHPGKPPEHIRIIATDYKDILNKIKVKTGFNPDRSVHEQFGIRITKNFNYSTWKSKAIKLLKQIILFPDEQKGWYNFALNEASEFLINESIDAIISTSYPVTSHLIARKLKQRYKIPWVADLRDPWSQNPYHDKFPLIKYFDRRLELKTLADADVLVTVTRPWIDTFKMTHKTKKIFYISNGYDDDDFPMLPSRVDGKFTLTYTGTLHDGKRDPSLLFAVVQQLINEKKIDRDLIDISFFVPKTDWLTDDIRKYDLEGVVNIYGFIPREKVLERQRESQILLLLLWDNKKEEGFCPGKVYEYLGARRPILAIGGNNHIVKDILETTNAGKYAWNSDTLRNILLEYYQEFIDSGKLKCNSNDQIENYSYKLLTKKYSDILDALVGGINS